MILYMESFVFGADETEAHLVQAPYGSSDVVIKEPVRHVLGPVDAGVVGRSVDDTYSPQYSGLPVASMKSSAGLRRL